MSEFRTAFAQNIRKSMTMNSPDNNKGGNNDRSDHTHPSNKSNPPARRTSTSGLLSPTATLTLNNNGIETVSSPGSGVYLDRISWLNLYGDGWLQVTPKASGHYTKTGLHNVIESYSGRTFAVLYEGQTTAASRVLLSSNPEYDLEVFGRALQDPSSLTSEHCYRILLAFKSADDYMAIHVDSDRGRYMLVRCYSGDITVLAEESDSKLKVNVFSKILVQVRGNLITLDINESPVFTSVQVPTVAAGLVGLWVRGCQCNFKLWKLRRCGTGDMLASGSGSGGKSGGSSGSGGGRVQATKRYTMSTSSSGNGNSGGGGGGGDSYHKSSAINTVVAAAARRKSTTTTTTSNTTTSTNKSMNSLTYSKLNKTQKDQIKRENKVRSQAYSLSAEAAGVRSGELTALYNRFGSGDMGGSSSSSSGGGSGGGITTNNNYNSNNNNNNNNSDSNTDDIDETPSSSSSPSGLSDIEKRMNRCAQGMCR